MKRFLVLLVEILFFVALYGLAFVFYLRHSEPTWFLYRNF